MAWLTMLPIVKWRFDNIIAVLAIDGLAAAFSSPALDEMPDSHTGLRSWQLEAGSKWFAPFAQSSWLVGSAAESNR